MLYLTCTTITSIDLAHYGVSRAKDWVSVDCGTITLSNILYCIALLLNISRNLPSMSFVICRRIYVYISFSFIFEGGVWDLMY